MIKKKPDKSMNAFLKTWDEYDANCRSINSTSCDIVEYKDGRRVVFIEPPLGTRDNLGNYKKDIFHKVMNCCTYTDRKRYYTADDIVSVQRRICIIPRQYLNTGKWKMY